MADNPDLEHRHSMLRPKYKAVPKPGQRSIVKHVLVSHELRVEALAARRTALIGQPVSPMDARAEVMERGLASLEAEVLAQEQAARALPPPKLLPRARRALTDIVAKLVREVRPEATDADVFAETERLLAADLAPACGCGGFWQHGEFVHAERCQDGAPAPTTEADDDPLAP